ncbi:mechanosensitive ion channel protein 4/5/6/7/8/9/10, partial [Tremellales sp. Uapishka_1]
MSANDGIKRTDYMGYTAPPPASQSQSNRLPPQEMSALSRDYLGTNQNAHLRDQSIDATTLAPTSPTDAYDPSSLTRENSRSALHTPGEEGYSSHSLAGSQSQYYVPAPQAAATATPPSSLPTSHVHYPPSPYLAKPGPKQGQDYTTIPLNSPYEATSSPMQSGRSTPNGTKKHRFSFLPMHSSTSLENTSEKEKRPKAASRSHSWDLLGGGRDRADWEEYNLATSSVANLRFAEGDAGTTKLSRMYYWLLNKGIVVRWAMYILPILALLWIPGIVGESDKHDATVWNVPLLWWSVWLSVLWLGFWAATAAFMMLPSIWRNTVGAIIPNARLYTDIIANLGRYMKLIAWTLAMWVSFTPLVINHYNGDSAATSRSDLTIFVNLLFGLFLCSLVLAGEKLLIQLIAMQFHKDSYEDRLRDQKFQIKCLTTLYINSRDIPGRSDTMTDADSKRTKGSHIPRMAMRKAMRGLRSVAANTTTALGNVASEMAGQSVLQTNSPANRVTAALNSAAKSKALARRLFYSFRQGGDDHLVLADVVRFFPDLETAQAAFTVLDIDENGDATRDEIETAVLGVHRERLSLEASMRDLDGAVRRLDDIFMVLVLVVVILIMAAMVTTKLTTLVTSAGTFILGLSWLIGSTMQEILLACIFLFVKHPFDVGDRVDIDGNSYTVARMQLMSTSFKRTDGKYVWIGNNILASKVIENVRRSGPTHETFMFEVAFDTSFEALQTLRSVMLNFCKENSRDFLPIFDVLVDDIPAQGKMNLKADIKYKSNWQQGALKVQRRNKWICALKMTMLELKIWGPAGAGDPAPPPPDAVRYTLVPYEDVMASSQPTSSGTPPPTFQTATAAATNASRLTDRREVINDSAQDIWNDQEELATAPSSRAATPAPMGVRSRTLASRSTTNEDIELDRQHDQRGR